MKLPAIVFLLLLPGGLLAQTARPGQSTVATVDVVGAAAAGQTGMPAQNRGIRGVTRRTSMILPGMEARAFFIAGGMDLGANTAVVLPVPAAPAPVAEAAPIELRNPEVQMALRQLAAAGDAEAKALLARPVPALDVLAPSAP